MAQRRPTTDPASVPALATELAAIADRAAGTDAERRAARRLEEELRALGRGARTETFWVRPNVAAGHALAAVLGLAGSVVSVDHPRTGLWLALAGLLLLLAELAGLPVLRLLVRERATPCVISPARTARKVTLVLCARIDAPRRGALGWIPAPLRLATAGLFGVSAMAALRVTDVEGDWMGPVQLVPTILLILAVGALLDAATAPADGTPAAAAGPPVALAVAELLHRVPPRHLAVEVVLVGSGGVGFAEHVRRLRHAGVRPEELAVVHVGDTVAAPLRFWRREGPLVPLAFHQRLVELAATDERLTGTGSATASPAYAARARRWPAIRIGGGRAAGPADPAVLDEAVDAVHGLVRQLDVDLDAGDAR